MSITMAATQDIFLVVETPPQYVTFIIYLKDTLGQEIKVLTVDQEHPPSLEKTFFPSADPQLKGKYAINTLFLVKEICNLLFSKYKRSSDGYRFKRPHDVTDLFFISIELQEATLRNGLTPRIQWTSIPDLASFYDSWGKTIEDQINKQGCYSLAIIGEPDGEFDIPEKVTSSSEEDPPRDRPELLDGEISKLSCWF